MITINNVTLRNLEEQVQKNKEDIAAHYAIDRAMSNLGIKVVGQVSSAQYLPDPLTYAGAYGDTYAVGDKTFVDQGRASYQYYVYTRPDPNAGQLENYWLNVGKISIAGPQGVQGIEGPQGPQGESSKWYTGANPPEADVNLNDMYLDSNGNVYQYTANNWILIENIKGPQGVQGIRGLKGEPGEAGPQGPKGDTGDAGGFINIYGIFSSTADLPDPAVIRDLSIAYLVGTSEPYDLYIQVGPDSATSVWMDMGPLNVATLVTSGGQYQNLWNADTKLDRMTHTTTYNQAYIKTADGGEASINVTKQVVDSAIPQRESTGNIAVALDPVNNNHATSKKYVDDKLAKKVDVPKDLPAGYKTVIGYNSNSLDIRPFAMAATTAGVGAQGTIAIYDTTGRLVSAPPEKDTDCATKKYVDDAVANAGGSGGGGGLTVYRHTFSFNRKFEDGSAFGNDTGEFLSYSPNNQVQVTSDGVYIGTATRGIGIIGVPWIDDEGSYHPIENNSYAAIYAGEPCYAYTFNDSSLSNEDLIENITPYIPQ